MPIPPTKRPLKMELEPDDANLLANLLAAFTALVDGLEQVKEMIDAVHVDVRALVKPAPRRGMERLSDVAADYARGTPLGDKVKP